MIFKPHYPLLFLLGAAQILWLPAITVPLLLTTTVIGLILVILRLYHQAWLPVLWLGCGLLYALLACQLQLDQQLSEPETFEVDVQIISLPKTTADKVSFIAENLTTGQKYLLSQYWPEGKPTFHYQVDHSYTLTINMKPPHGTANGVGFDREKWLFRHGIDGIGHIKQSRALTQAVTPVFSINQWRAWLSSQIDQHFTHPTVNGLIHALSIGDKTHLSQHDKQLFQNTGTAHLIAISGLHIGMVALLGWYLGGIFYRLWPRQKLPRPVIQVILGIMFAAFYAALAGFTVATQRALIMLVIYGLFKLFRRPGYAWDVWSTSLLLVLLLDPLNVLDGGFWLSFTAVAVLILAFSGTEVKRSKLLVFLAMQITLLVGMLPLNLAMFSKVNFLTPLVNVIMIPLMTFLLIPLLMLLLLLASLFQSFPEPLVTWVQMVSAAQLDLLSWFNQADYFNFQVVVNHWWQYVVLALGAWLLSLPAMMPQRYWGLLLVLLGLLGFTERPSENHFTAYFLDVGQGLSVVIETQNQTVIYDVGAAYESGFNMADAVVLPFLQQRNTDQISHLILSHQDNDHAGAYPALLAGVHVDEIWGTQDNQRPCVAGQQWQIDGVTFIFISPLNLSPYLQNNSSCVLQVSTPSFSLLLTGDIESPVEYRLLQTHAHTINANVMLIPHHGSKTSSTPAFIDAVNPDFVINSSGRFNPFKHPANDVVMRYQHRNIPIIDTQSSGLITLRSDDTRPITTLRRDQPRIWRTKKPD